MEELQKDRIECYKEALEELKRSHLAEFRDIMKRKMREKGWEVYP